jgi:two-component system cell cycle sensor histidine kinase/response regulator CckA
MERTGFEQWRPREVARLLALVETEKRYYQEMVAALPAALVVLAHDRTVLSANLVFRRIAGLSGEELRKRTIEQILPSDELIERLRAAHVHGDTGSFLITIGERRFRMAAAPIRGWEDDMELETLLMVQPVEVPQAQAPPAAQAPQPEAPIAAAAPPVLPVDVPIAIVDLPKELAVDTAVELDMLPAAVWQADASTFAFTRVGGAAEEILGYSEAHWLAEPLFFSERIHPEDRVEVMDLYRSVAGSGGAASAEYRALNASGAAVWCRETVRVPAPEGSMSSAGARFISGVLSAVGERRQLEAQALAAGRIDALRALANRLAHDLNNPLMILTGYGEELLNALPAGSSVREDLAEVLAASSRLTELAGHLLSFARSQAKEPSRIDLSKLVEALAPRLRDACGGNVSGDLEIGSPEGAVWTFADPEQLEDAIVALAAGGIENTSGASRLSLICRTVRVAERVEGATLRPGMHARLDIQAAGVGVGTPAPGIFESILPNKDLHKPSGPSVARAYLDVRQWGGDIAFSSSAEQGSTFSLYLPHAELERAAVSEQAPAPEIAEVEPTPEPGIEPAAAEPPPVEPPPAIPSLGTILVVEDEPGIRGLVRKILKRENFEVIEAGNGEEALAAASSHGASIGLLLTDVMLPGIGGRELAEALVAAQADLKVVYISGFTDDESVRAGQFPPGSIFLQKPFTLSALVGVVKTAFGL